jgi:hypothetical protein
MGLNKKNGGNNSATIVPAMCCRGKNWQFLRLELTEQIWEPIQGEATVGGPVDAAPGEILSIITKAQEYKLVLLEKIALLDKQDLEQTVIKLVHPLYFLKKSKRIRFFYKKTIAEIFKECLKEHAISCSIKISKAKPEELHVQYEESTLVFLRRIALAHGLFLIAKPDGSVLVASEKVLKSLVKSKKSLTRAGYCKSNELKLIQETTFSSQKKHQIIQYMPKNPSKVFKKADKGGKIFQDHFYSHVRSISRGDKLIKQLTAPEKKNKRYLAQSNDYIGIFTTVEDYFVTKTTVKATKTSASGYDLIHRAVITPLDYYYETNQIPPLTATVVGKKKATDLELNTKEKYPRVLVGFHCDPQEQKIPVKMGCLMASGTSYSLLTPEIGTEVTIMLLNGEPMIIATNPNNQYPNPGREKKLRDHHYGFIFGTKLDPKRYSSFLVNTQKKQEEIHFRAQKDMTTQLVEGKYALELLGDKTTHSTKITKGDYDLEIKSGNFSINLKKGSGKLCFSDNLTLEARNIQLKGQSIEINAKNKLEMSCATGSLKATKFALNSKMLELQGKMIKIAGTLIKLASKALMSIDSKLLKQSSKLRIDKNHILIQKQKIELSDCKAKIQMTKICITVGLFLAEKVLVKGIYIPGF